MKPSAKTKWIGLLCIMAVVSLLGGCVTKPDSTNNGTTGAGYSASSMPWDNIPMFSTIPPLETATLAIAPILTPTLAPFGSSTINLPSPILGGLVTPSMVITGFATLIPSAPPTATLIPTATPLILKLGSTGTAVRSMQSRLKQLGYAIAAVDGDFGQATQNALKAFQARNGLTADGIAGPATLARINSAAAVRARITPKPTAVPPKATATPSIDTNTYLRLGDRGTEVRRMQTRLIALGYLAGQATGIFEGATEAAVTAFQTRNVSYADGVAGPMTLSALYSSNAKRANSSAGTIGVSLRKGTMDSDAVRTLQRRLKDLRYYTGEIDGDFGTSTEVAVKAFQMVNSLSVDGVAGEDTLSLLYSNKAKRADSSILNTPAPGGRVTPIPQLTPVPSYRVVTPEPNGNYVVLRFGDSGVLVNNLQQALKRRGYLEGTVDGKYGIGTLDAVKRFQADYGLSQDGDAGPATQRVLFEGDFPIGS
ncbi:MAG: peptidoglycan-binding protein [Christensenellales bacterium]